MLFFFSYGLFNFLDHYRYSYLLYEEGAFFLIFYVCCLLFFVQYLPFQSATVLLCFILRAWFHGSCFALDCMHTYYHFASPMMMTNHFVHVLPHIGDSKPSQVGFKRMVDSKRMHRCRALMGAVFFHSCIDRIDAFYFIGGGGCGCACGKGKTNR